MFTVHPMSSDNCVLPLQHCLPTMILCISPPVRSIDCNKVSMYFLPPAQSRNAITSTSARDVCVPGAWKANVLIIEFGHYCNALVLEFFKYLINWCLRLEEGDFIISCVASPPAARFIEAISFFSHRPSLKRFWRMSVLILFIYGVVRSKWDAVTSLESLRFFFPIVDYFLAPVQKSALLGEER